MVKMQCRECKNIYVRATNAPYKKLCPPCYKKRYAIPLTDSDKSLIAVNEAYKALTIKSDTLKSKYEDLIHSYEAIQHRRPDDFSLRLKTLLSLCHPDKHNNNQTATEITQWLLSNRCK